MSSEEDYQASSSSEGNDGSDFEEEEGEEEERPAPVARRNARRYTTADIDREIAAQAQAHGGSGDSDSGSGGSSDDSDAEEGSGEDSDEEERPKPKGRAGARRGRGAIRSPVRRTGVKQPAKKAAARKAAQRKGSKNGATKRRRHGSDSEEEASSSEEILDEDDGGEWNEDASDAIDSNDNDSAGSDGSDDDDSDSDFGAPRRRKRGVKKKATNGRGKGRGGGGARGKKPAAKPRTPAGATRAIRATRSYYKQSSSSEEEEEEVQYDATPGGTRRPRRQCKSRTQQKMHDMVQKDMQSEKEALAGVLEDDDQELLENSDRGESGSSDEEEDAARGAGRGAARDGKKDRDRKTGATPKKRGNKYDDDESYDDGAPSGASDSSEDDDMSDFEESDDGVTEQNTRKSMRKRTASKATSYKDVDESDFGTADEDSEDADNGPSILMSPARKGRGELGGYGSPNMRRRARMGRTPLDVREEGESSEESEQERKPRSKRRKPSAGSDDESDSSEQTEGSEAGAGKLEHALLTNPYKKCTKSPSTLKTTQICCPSTIDDITMMKLPKNKPHVCYIAPDGKTRHCFTLETLYRIAISSNSNNNVDNNVVAALDNVSPKKLEFLQPPHFRSPMEDDLLDQIASRFGRAALVIENSAVYKKMRGGFHTMATALDDELDEFDSDGEYVGDGEGGAPRSFGQRFERYMQNLMGSNDVYCCPLCYNEADRRLGNGGDEEMCEDDETSRDGDKREESKDRMSFLDDPLTILGSLDGEQFEVAASFCFRRLAGLKTHLKVVHGVKTSDVEGNDLFKRFQIRAGDGLLQSWLRKSLRQNTVRQGDMMRYWLNGENQSFVLLLSQIDRNGLRGEQSGEYEGDFSTSFPNRAKRIWRDVSAPYLKDTRDMEDFITEEGDESGEECEGDAVPVNPHFTPPNGEGESAKSPEEQMIEHLRRKNRGRSAFDNSDDDSSSLGDGDMSDEDDLEVLPKPPQYEEAEEEDTWIKLKRTKKARHLTHNHSDSSGNFSEDNGVFDAGDATGRSGLPEANGSARKRVIDDGGGVDLSAERSRPGARVNGSARKRVFESSDEED